MSFGLKYVVPALRVDYGLRGYSRIVREWVLLQPAPSVLAFTNAMQANNGLSSTVHLRRRQHP